MAGRAKRLGCHLGPVRGTGAGKMAVGHGKEDIRCCLRKPGKSGRACRGDERRDVMPGKDESGNGTRASAHKTYPKQMQQIAKPSHTIQRTLTPTISPTTAPFQPLATMLGYRTIRPGGIANQHLTVTSAPCSVCSNESLLDQ